MIQLCHDRVSQADWNSIVPGFDDLSLLQTWEYGQASAQTRSLQVERMVFTDGGQIVGAAQGFMRSVPVVGGGAVFINRGPLWRRDGCDEATLSEMLVRLREHWVGVRGMYLRVAPPIGIGLVPKALFIDAGYQEVVKARPWISSRLDLSIPIDVLRRSLRSNWNASLKKAEALGVSVETGVSTKLLDQVKAEQARLVSRKGFHTPVAAPFLDAFQALASDKHKLLSITASNGSAPLGGVVLARYGSTCEYLISAVTEAGKASNVGQLLLWSAVVKAKEMGYRWFDLGGMDPEMTAKGVFYFKSALGGASYQLIGDFEAFSGGLINRAIRWKLDRALQDVQGGSTPKLTDSDTSGKRIN